MLHLTLNLNFIFSFNMKIFDIENFQYLYSRYLASISLSMVCSIVLFSTELKIISEIALFDNSCHYLSLILHPSCCINCNSLEKKI
jgi:hypothetical protein